MAHELRIGLDLHLSQGPSVDSLPLESSMQKCRLQTGGCYSLLRCVLVLTLCDDLSTDG